MISPSIEQYPKIIIQYCNKCKWQNRAIWYLQEILQTFPDKINDISIQPINDQPGVFQIILLKSHDDQEIIYKRKFKSKELAEKYGDSNEESYHYDGFPDSKFVKLLIKDRLGLEVGKHIEKKLDYKLNDGCVDCKREE